MDRFIVAFPFESNPVLSYLKSNMDRFIACIYQLKMSFTIFKIQYG